MTGHEQSILSMSLVAGECLARARYLISKAFSVLSQVSWVSFLFLSRKKTSDYRSVCAASRKSIRTITLL